MATDALSEKPAKQSTRGKRGAELAIGAVLLGLGVLLLGASIGYHIYGRVARSNLDELSFAVERPQIAGQGYERPAMAGVSRAAPAQPPLTGIERPPEPSGGTAASKLGPAAGDEATAAASAGGSTPARTQDQTSADAAKVVPADGSIKAAATTRPETDGKTEQTLASVTVGTNGAAAPARTTEATGESGELAPAQVAATDAGQEDDAEVARPASDLEPDPALAAIEASKVELATYTSPTSADLAGAGSLATRIRIPAIGVDATISELRIIVLGNSLAWETPNRVVGHIPETAAAAARGQGWYFGHLESPLRGEGNVFRRLPDIPKLAGEQPIYIFLETAEGKYAYQVYRTEVVYQDELAITDSGNHDITLVTCTPRFYYDHRLLVTAALVGVQES